MGSREVSGCSDPVCRAAAIRGGYRGPGHTPSETSQCATGGGDCCPHAVARPTWNRAWTGRRFNLSPVLGRNTYGNRTAPVRFTTDQRSLIGVEQGTRLLERERSRGRWIIVSLARPHEGDRDASNWRAVLAGDFQTILFPPACSRFHPKDRSGDVLAFSRHAEQRLSDLRRGLDRTAVQFIAKPLP